MSLTSLCKSHKCTLVTHTHTQGATGARITAPGYFYGNDCRIVPVSARTQRDFGQIGMTVDYQLFFTYNPRTKTAGAAVKRIQFEDENGNTRTVKVQGEKNPDQLGRFWRYDCEELTQVENRA